MSVTALIVTHQSRALMDACLDSLDEHAAEAGLTVLVSDSNSTDGVDELCRRRGVAFLPGPNDGFGAAVNRALSHELVQRAEYVLIMNPDVTILEGRLADWIAELDRRPGCGILSPRQLTEEGNLLLTIGREPTPSDYWLAARTLHSDWVPEHEAYDSEALCDWTMGSFMLVRRAVLEQIGGFDERFFLFSEEVDLCTRVRRAGFDVAYVPSLSVTHAIALRPPDEHRERMVMWSQLLYIRKWHPPLARLSMRIALVARFSRHIARAARRRGSSRMNRVRLGAVLRFRPDLYGPPRMPAEQSEQ